LCSPCLAHPVLIWHPILQTRFPRSPCTWCGSAFPCSAFSWRRR
jgi:hypothetical protein